MAGSPLGDCRHVCAFFRTPDGHFDAERMLVVMVGAIFDAVRTHRMTLLGGVLQENPFYVPPEIFLQELRARTEPRDEPGAVAAASHAA